MTADRRGWFWDMIEGRKDPSGALVTTATATVRIVGSDGQGPVWR